MAVEYIYWTSTILLSALYLASAAMYIAKPAFVYKAQADLGFSARLLVPLMIVVKILGPIAILSRFNMALSDLAYAGMFYHLLLSASAHLGVRRPKAAAPAVVAVILLVASFATQNFARQGHSPYAPVAAVMQHVA